MAIINFNLAGVWLLIESSSYSRAAFINFGAIPPSTSNNESTTVLNPRRCCYEMIVAICCSDCNGRHALQDKMHSVPGPSHERGWPRKTN